MTLTTLFTVLCGMSIAAAFIPLAWHIRNRNTSAICLIVWITLFNIFTFINALIWGGPNIFTAWDGKIFCDIEVKFFIAAGAGVVGSTASISRNLAKVMSNKISVVKTRAVRRRELIKDLAMCLGLPVWMVATHYIVQPSRYYLLATTGCTPTMDNSLPTVFLLFIWPPILSLVSAFYAGELSFSQVIKYHSHFDSRSFIHTTGLVLLRIHRYRKEFSEIVRSSNMTSSRFLRLFLLALVLVLVNLPLTFYVLYRNLIVGMIPYDWALVHSVSWGRIHRLPTYDFVQFDRWISVGSGFLLFIFFGMGTDAFRMYRGWLLAIGVGRFLPDFIMGVKKPKEARYSDTETETGTWKGSTLVSYISKRFTSRKPLLSVGTTTLRCLTPFLPPSMLCSRN